MGRKIAIFRQLTNEFPVADDTGSEWFPPLRFSFLFNEQSLGSVRFLACFPDVS